MTFLGEKKDSEINVKYAKFQKKSVDRISKKRWLIGKTWIGHLKRNG